MKNLYILLLFILFVQCEQPSNQSAKGWEKTDVIKADSVFKDRETEEAIRQVIAPAQQLRLALSSGGLPKVRRIFLFLYDFVKSS